MHSDKKAFHNSHRGDKKKYPPMQPLTKVLIGLIVLLIILVIAWGAAGF
jgi:hypothetical protein